MARECGKKLSARGSPSCTSAATTTGMRVALAALVCVLACMPAVLGAFPKKRTYDLHHYYVAELVQRDPCSAQVTPEHVARALDAELVERVGELEGIKRMDAGCPTSHMVGFFGLNLANHVETQLRQLSGLGAGFLLPVFGDIGNP